MKKLFTLALAIMASASSFAQLSSSSDSVSYAAGMSVTDGLIPFIVEQHHVDTAYRAEFIAGFREAVENASDPKVKARLVGMSIAQQLNERMLPGVTKEFKDSPDSIIPARFYDGFAAALLKDSTHFTMAKAQKYFTAKLEADKAAREERLYGANRTAGREFLAENAKKEGVITLPSGLQYKVLVQGTGEVPQQSDKVKVNYEGRLLDGTVFDSSYERGQAAEFTPTQVIKGWTEALTMMPVGSKWQLYIPYELAYGSRDTGKIKPFSMLIFDVELLEIVKK